MSRSSVVRVKLSVFRMRYFSDESSRPSKNTIVSHIKNDLLSGEQIGNLWYVKCTEWGDPIYYRHQPSIDQEFANQLQSTGNKTADQILASIR